MITGLICREMVRRFGVHRNTIIGILQYSAPPGYQQRALSLTKKLGQYIAWINKILVDDPSAQK